MQKVTDEQLALLEHMVDTTSVAAVLYALADVCRLKAEHVSVNWQDKHLARWWEQRGGKIDQLAAKFT